MIVKRDYSTAELQKKLMLDGFQKNAAVQRAVEVGLVNDSRFGQRAYIRSKISQGWGPLLKNCAEIFKKGN